jgi:hypothetical protein
LSIRGGNLTASGSSGAGVGSGRGEGVTSVSRVTSIEITGGNLDAVGESAAGLGSGFGYLSGSSIVNNLTIAGGTVRARGSLGAGIGSGRAERDSGTSLVTELTVVNATIEAVGSSAAGIGSGYACSSGRSSVLSVRILSGNITASGSAGAGIGSGDAYLYGNSSVTRLTLSNGTINAKGLSAGAGVGSGLSSSHGDSNVPSLIIVNGKISAIGSSKPGIGGTDSLTFSGVSELSAYSTADSFPIDASSIIFANASVIAQTSGSRVFGRSPVGSGDSELSLLYQSVTASGSEPLSGFGGHFLQIGELNFPDIGDWHLRIFAHSYERSFPVIVGPSKLASLIMSVPAAGDYRVDAVSGSANGYLESISSGFVFAVDGFSFVAEAHFVEGPSPPEESKGDNTSIGLVIGVVIGVCLVVIAVIVLLSLLVRMKKLRFGPGLDSKILSPEDSAGPSEFVVPGTDGTFQNV